jgi:hypothetical protein
VYAVFGTTVTFCEHCAKSDAVALPWTARVPVWTGVVTTEAAEHVHGLREPVSNPGFATRFAACAGPEASSTPAPASAIAPTTVKMRLYMADLSLGDGRYRCEYARR